MTDLRKAAGQALEVLETLDVGDSYKTHNAASALRQALAEDALQKLADIDHSLGLYDDAVNISQECVDETAKREHEPVAWLDSDGFPWSKEGVECRTTQDTYTPLYTAPPKREWVGLTNKQINELARWADEHAAPFYLEFAKAIEAKLKEKNGG